MKDKDYAINVTAGKCWCPVCERNNRPVGAIVPWVAADGKLVCIYCGCEECAATVRNYPKARMAKLLELVERRLVARYPSLLRKLPEGYLNASQEKV